MSSPTLEVEQYLGELRDTKNLATALKVSRDYILAMKHHGFRMPGGKATLRMAHHFIANCDDFMVRERRPASPQPPAASSDTPRERPLKRDRHTP